MGIDNDDTEALTRRLRGGDTASLAQLFALHRERLETIARFRLDPRLRPRLDVDDVLQESYLAAEARIRHFVEDASLSAFLWMRLILQQTLVDLHRRHLGAQRRDMKREVPAHAKITPDASVSIAAFLAADGSTPSRVVMRQETYEQLEEALQGMNPTDREVLALRHFEELTNQEIARVLGIEEKAASIRYMRALRRLREILASLSDFASRWDPGRPS